MERSIVGVETQSSSNENDQNNRSETGLFGVPSDDRDAVKNPSADAHSNRTSRSLVAQWNQLDDLVKDFHNCIDVELPALLKFILAKTDDHVCDTSRQCFDLRRCLRCMYELVMRQELLDLFDHQANVFLQSGELPNGKPIDSFKSNDDGSCDERNWSILLRTFTEDVVELVTMTTFDTKDRSTNYDATNVTNNRNVHPLNDSGIHQLHHSLVISALQHIPLSTKLHDEEISKLLSRVLSLMEQELSSTCSTEKGQHSRLQYNLPGTSISASKPEVHELIENLLSWLNREMTSERLMQVLYQSPNQTASTELATALEVVLTFWNEIPRNYSNDSPDHSQLILSIRVMIDVLLQTFEHIVIAEGNHVGSTNFPSTVCVRDWVNLSSTVGNISTDLLLLLDRYGLELVEESMELLRSRQPSLSHSIDERSNVNDVSCSVSGSATTCKKERVLRALQYAAMTTNLLSILEPDTTHSGNTNDMKPTSSILVGLSRSYWNSLGHFVVEQVNTLGGTEAMFHEGWDEDLQDLEECQMAATDVLVRLTKSQIRDIVFQNQTNVCTSFKLTEEEVSIVVTTILRMLGHPEEYWTKSDQEWVASLLQARYSEGRSNEDSIGRARSNLGPRLQTLLQTVLLCNSCVSSGLSLEQQRFVQSTLTELLLQAQAKSNLKPSPQDNNAIQGSQMNNPAMNHNPWQTFWPVSIHHKVQ